MALILLTFLDKGTLIVGIRLSRWIIDRGSDEWIGFDARYWQLHLQKRTGVVRLSS